MLCCQSRILVRDTRNRGPRIRAVLHDQGRSRYGAWPCHDLWLCQTVGRNVTIQSELGHGTTVALWLPMAKGSAEAVKQDHQAVAPKTAKGAERLVVLAVDDNAIVLLGTTAMLEGLGHRALKATSGKEALDILRREESVDLVITDQAMPGMTGVQLANVIKVEWPAMPILLVTGYAELPPGPEPGCRSLPSHSSARSCAGYR